MKKEKREFFEPSGYFYEEPMNLLRQEFRSPSLYSSLLSAIASGATRIKEMQDKTGFDSAKIVQALDELLKIRILYKDIPLLNEKNKGLQQYRLKNGMFRFYFGYVVKGINAIERGYGKEYFEAMVKPHLHEFMGEVFEEMAQDYLWKEEMLEKYGFPLLQVGKWRENDPIKKILTDIDVVGISSPEKKEALIGECKFKNEPIGKEEVETLLDRARLVNPYQVKGYFLFSLSGFTDWIKEKAEKEPSIHLVSMEELYK